MSTINIQSLTELRAAKTADLVAFYNHHADKPVKKFATRATAEKRVAALCKEMTGPLPEVFEPKKKAASKKTTAKKTSAKKDDTGSVGKRSQYAGKKIHAKVKVNPRRTGTHGFRSMAIILENDGLTYEQYIEKGGRNNDLRWDIEHDNVRCS